MPLVFICGSPGTGKSSVQRRLARLGYDAYDVDDRSIGGSFNKGTGQEVPIPPAAQRTPNWLATHEWKIKRHAIEALKIQSAYKKVFLCGTAANENEVWDMFDKVLFLDIDEEKLQKRISDRIDNDYGKNDFEMKQILERHKTARKQNERYGATFIDASQTLEKVIGDVLETTGH